MFEVTQSIRNAVADYLSPPGSVLTSAEANRHEAEEIRAGRQDGNALVQLVARCVVERLEDAAKAVETSPYQRAMASHFAARALKKDPAR